MYNTAELGDQHIEVLQFNDPFRIVEQLAAKLAARDTLWGLPQIIVIPSPTYRQWLEEELVARLGVSIGLEFCALDQLPDRLATGGRRAPLPVELGAAIEHTLRSWWPSAEHGAAPHQACTLTYLFGQYGLYGEQLLQNWPSSSPMACEQRQLWEGFFCKHPEVLPLVTRLRAYRTVHRRAEVHLVGQSSTPAAWLRWLAAISHHTPVTLYHLCATPLWMGDTLSAKQLSFGLKKLRDLGLAASCYQSQLEQILERQPLLADLGRVPRIFQRDIAEIWENAWSEDDHSAADQTQTAGTLQALRADLAAITRSVHKPCVIHNLHHHMCRSKLHEVRVCLKQIIEYMNANPQAAWHELMVACSDPESYRPLIDGVIAAEQLVMPIRWVDGGFRGTLVDWLLKALELVLSRWSFVDIERLLLHPAMAACHQWGSDEITALHRMLLSLKIWWGESAEHRQQWLSEQLGHCDDNISTAGQGTWCDSFKQAFIQLLQDPQQQLLSPELWPCLDQLMQPLLALRQLRLQLCETQPLSVAACATAVAHFLQTAGTGNLAQSDEVLRLLKNISHNQILAAYPLPASSSLRWLASTLDSLRANSQTSGIWAGSLSALRGIGCRAMFILGLDEDSFPTPWNPEPFNLLEGRERYPTRGDYDRLCLLECLLCAREHLELFAHVQPGDTAHHCCHAVQAILDAAEAITGASCTVEHSWELASPEFVSEEAVPQVHVTTRERRITPDEFCRDLQQPLRCYLRHSMRFRSSMKMSTEPIEFTGYQRTRHLLESLKGVKQDHLLPRGRLQDLVDTAAPSGSERLSEIWLGEAPHDINHPITIYPRWSSAQGLHVEGSLGWADDSCLLLPLGSQPRALRHLPKLCLWALLHPQGSYGDLMEPERRWPLPAGTSIEMLELLAELHILAQRQPLPSGVDELMADDAHHMLESWQRQLQALSIDPHHELPPIPDRAYALGSKLMLLLKGQNAAGEVHA